MNNAIIEMYFYNDDDYFFYINELEKKGASYEHNGDDNAIYLFNFRYYGKKPTNNINNIEFQDNNNQCKTLEIDDKKLYLIKIIND